jgi:hypothetical protein
MAPEPTKAAAPPSLATLLADEPGDFARHPNDGWQLASPYGLGTWANKALVSVVTAMLPSRRGPVDARTIERVANNVRTTLTYMARPSAWGLVALLCLLDLAPLWRRAQPRRLGALSAVEGAALLDRVAESRFRLLRTMVTAARAAVLTGYYDLPEVHEVIGYAPRPHFAERLALRQRILAGYDAGVSDAPQPHALRGVPPLTVDVAPGTRS